MSIDFVLIAIVASYLQKSLKKESLYPQLQKQISLVVIISLALFSAGFFVTALQPTLRWLGKAALLGMIYLLIRKPALKNNQLLIIAFLPYIIISIVQLAAKDIFPKLTGQWKIILETASVFSVLWGIGVWIFSARQRKELEKSMAKIAEQEEKNRLAEEMKDELERQVSERTSEITRQKEALEKTLAELKATQTQLIHSEKMASLGELTAGIAHEIQNPLNFVNNFSEVSNELIDEMKEDLESGDSQSVMEIAHDLKQNLEKINFHGKRADSIVKGMLQHSRGTSGQREPTNINTLADEYLRLSYHGLRAKDKSFNSKFDTNLDSSIPMLNVVPQDIGRVILNLLNNAFYAVNQKKKTAGADYQPEVTITTKNLGNQVEVIIRDNGTGMPPEMISKIFQPFFTTKPTGEGTGLGLSLSYDIIKVHGGELSVESVPDKSTTFKIVLPYI